MTYQRSGDDDAVADDPVMTSLSTEWDLDAALEMALQRQRELNEQPVLRLKVTILDETMPGLTLYDAIQAALFHNRLCFHLLGVDSMCISPLSGFSPRTSSPPVRSLTHAIPAASRQVSRANMSSAGRSLSLGDDWLVVEERPSLNACQGITNEKPDFLPARIVKATCGRLIQAVREMSRKMALSQSDWLSYLDPKGRVVRADEMRAKVFFGGIHPELRPIIWRHLLGVFPANMTAKERMQYVIQFHKKYLQLRKEWQSKDPSEIRQLTDMVMKDVRRTDRRHPYFNVDDGHPRLLKLHNVLVTYAVNNPDVSYAQGMSDLASPFIVLYEMEADSYMCFSQLMKRMKYHFVLDSTAIRQKFSDLRQLLQHADFPYYDYLKQREADDLLFCYRWVLLDMKREFEFSDALKTLEITWSVIPNIPGPGDEPYELPFAGDVIEEPIRSLSDSENDLFDVDFQVGEQQRFEEEKEDDEEDDEEEDGMGAVVEEFNSLIPSEFSLNWDPPPAKGLSEEDRHVIASESGQFKSGLSLTASTETTVTVTSTSTMNASKPNDTADANELRQTLTVSNDQVDSLDDLNSLQVDPFVCGAGNPFTMCACLALLLQQRDHIMQNELDYNELAMHYDRSSRKQNFSKFLARARSLFISYLKQSHSSDMSATFTAICNVDFDV